MLPDALQTCLFKLNSVFSHQISLILFCKILSDGYVFGKPS